MKTVYDVVTLDDRTFTWSARELQDDGEWKSIQKSSVIPAGTVCGTHNMRETSEQHAQKNRKQFKGHGFSVVERIVHE